MGNPTEVAYLANGGIYPNTIRPYSTKELKAPIIVTGDLEMEQPPWGKRKERSGFKRNWAPKKRDDFFAIVWWDT